MPELTTLTIDGQSVNLRQVVLGRLAAFVKDGIPSLTFYQRGGPLPDLPDPYLGKEVVLRINQEIQFQGNVVSSSPHYEPQLGWLIAYQCLGFRVRGNWVPYTDENTGTDTTGFNLQPDDPKYQAALAGRTVGQMLSIALTMPTNAKNLFFHRLGNYHVDANGNLIEPVVLPTNTVADLAAINVIPPRPVYLGGQKLVGAIDALLASMAPNYTLWIEPSTGAFRFLDMRLFGGSGYNTAGVRTLTMDDEPIIPTGLSRDVTECAARVLVRGQPWTEPVLLTTKNGSLVPDWTSAQQAAWTPSNFNQPTLSGGQDVGNAQCLTTLQVKCTSTAAVSVPANYWDQTTNGAHGRITLQVTANTGINVGVTRQIVSNTASASGVMTVTLDLPLPVTTFTTYTIFGLQTSGLGAVWRRYKVANSAIGKALQTSFPYPVAYVGSGGASASLTSVPIGSVLWSTNGNPPYNQFPLPFSQTVDPTGADSYFLFVMPTYEIANNSVPAEVQVYAAVATGANHAFAPPNTGASPIGTPPSDPNFVEGTAAYAGTSHTVEGNTSTLVVTEEQWRDPTNIQAMYAYAADILDSVKDAIVEGEITIICTTRDRLEQYLPLLSMGYGIEVTGRGYRTGWENTSNLTSFGRGLQVVAVDLEWTITGPVPWILHLRCSNRRAYNTAQMFLRPDRTGLTWNPMQFEQIGLPGLGVFDSTQLQTMGVPGFEAGMPFSLGTAASAFGGAAWGGWQPATGPLQGLQGAVTGGMNALASQALGAVGGPAEAGLAGMQGMAASAMGAMARPTSAAEIAAGNLAGGLAAGADYLGLAGRLGMDVGGAAAHAIGGQQYPPDRRTVEQKTQDVIAKRDAATLAHGQKVQQDLADHAAKVAARYDKGLAPMYPPEGTPPREGGFVTSGLRPAYPTPPEIAGPEVPPLPVEPNEVAPSPEPPPPPVPDSPEVAAALDQPFGPEIAPTPEVAAATPPTSQEERFQKFMSHYPMPEDRTPGFLEAIGAPIGAALRTILPRVPGPNEPSSGGAFRAYAQSKPGEGLFTAIAPARTEPSSPAPRRPWMLGAWLAKQEAKANERYKGVWKRDYGSYGSE